MKFFEKVRNLIAALRLREDDQRAQREAAFGDLVATLLAEEEVDAEEAAEVLAEAGKSADDLEQAVEKSRRRRAMRDELAERPKLIERRQELAEQRSALQAEEAQLMSGLQERSRALALEAAQNEVKISRLAEIERRLVAECSDPALLRTEAEQRTRRQELAAEIRVLERRLEPYRATTVGHSLRTAELEAAKLEAELVRQQSWAAPKEAIADLENRVGHARERVEQLRRAVEPLRERLAAAKAEFREVDDADRKLQIAKVAS